jgi:hypothetical protein
MLVQILILSILRHPDEVRDKGLVLKAIEIVIMIL